MKQAKKQMEAVQRGSARKPAFLVLCSVPAPIALSHNRNHLMELSWTLVLNCGLISLAASVAQAADNTPPPGFAALFNGKDLTGWKGLVADPPARAEIRRQADRPVEHVPH